MSPLEHELHDLLAVAGIFVFEVDSRGRVTYATPELCQLLGHVGPDGAACEPVVYPLIRADVQCLLQGCSIVPRELSLGGRTYLLSGSSRLQPDGQRRAVLRLVDIVGINREQDLMRMAAASTDHAIFTLDPEGCVTSWNSAAQRIFGYPEEQILGQHFELLFTREDRENGIPADEMERARDRGRADDERWHVRADGRRFYCSGVLTPLRNGPVHGYVKIARDLTERRRAEREREVMLRLERIVRTRAQVANQLKDEFLAVMSHELKHPLNLIYANAEILTRLPEVQASQVGRRAATVIQGAVLSQAKIIDDLLDLSRLHTGKLRLVRARLDWRQTLETVVEACAGQAQAQDIRLWLEPGPPVWLDADEVRIEQIVWNLLSNALKFTPPGGRIEVSLLPEATEDSPAGAWLRVQDTGRGIEPTELPRVFEMFTQANGYTTRSEGGLGVGLAMVRQLAELHGGRVQAHSDGVGLGASFGVWLPLASNATPEAVTGSPGPVADGFSGSLSGVRVLLVDDSPETLEAFQQLLVLEGAQVTSAGSGAAALLRARDEDYDVILSDIGMPVMDGNVLLARLREMPRHARVPAVALTGYGRDEDMRRAREAGFDAHLSKPVRLQSLLDVLVGLSIQRAS